MMDAPSDTASWPWDLSSEKVDEAVAAGRQAMCRGLSIGVGDVPSASYDTLSGKVPTTTLSAAARAHVPGLSDANVLDDGINSTVPDLDLD